MREVLDHALDADERAALERFAARVRERYGDRLLKLVLFGSRATGDTHEDSDIDVLVVLRGQVGCETRWDITHLATDCALEGEGFADITPRTLAETDWQRLLREEWRLALDAEREGIPL